MLDIYIIEQIRKREEELRRRNERPVLELPLEPPMRQPKADEQRQDDDENESKEEVRVIIIDL